MLYNEVYEKLEKYGQIHLLKYYDSLNEEEKVLLLEEINMVDFDLLSLCDGNVEIVKKGKIEPISVLTVSDIEKNKDEYYKLGIKAIKAGKVGAVLLAGGQGTRLGFDKPKGMLNVGITKELYLFEVLIQNIMEVVRKADAWVPLLIMTSIKNNEDTIDFFEENNYFGYSKDYVTFFIQEMAPSVDYNGKIYMEEKGKLSMSPNGNGGWYLSLEKCGILDKIKEQGIEWINVFSVDNVLQKIADPYFVGATIASKYSVGTKVIKKAAPDEKVGVICKENSKPSIIEYYELTEEIMNSKDENGEPAYNYGVTLNYLFNIYDLEKKKDKQIPVHVVEKKIPYMDENGNYVKPEAPNGHKFETLVLDMIHMFDDVLVYETIRNQEFAPIKNKDGVDSLDSARKLLLENNYKL